MDYFFINGRKAEAHECLIDHGKYFHFVNLSHELKDVIIKLVIEKKIALGFTDYSDPDNCGLNRQYIKVNDMQIGEYNTWIMETINFVNNESHSKLENIKRVSFNWNFIENLHKRLLIVKKQIEVKQEKTKPEGITDRQAKLLNDFQEEFGIQSDPMPMEVSCFFYHTPRLAISIHSLRIVCRFCKMILMDNELEKLELQTNEAVVHNIKQYTNLRHSRESTHYPEYKKKVLETLSSLKKSDYKLSQKEINNKIIKCLPDEVFKTKNWELLEKNIKIWIQEYISEDIFKQEYSNFISKYPEEMNNENICKKMLEELFLQNNLLSGIKKERQLSKLMQWHKKHFAD